MPSNKEILFQQHIVDFLERKHKYNSIQKEDLEDKEFHIVRDQLVSFIKGTQPDKYELLEENFGSDAPQEIIKALKGKLVKSPLWLIMRDGLLVRGISIELYKPKPRSSTSNEQLENYEKNQLAYKTEYRCNNLTDERIDLVVWLNGLPVIVMELKHEDEGQTVEDAISYSFLTQRT